MANVSVVVETTPIENPLGKIFTWEDGYYIFAQVGQSIYSFINLAKGSRLIDGVVGDPLSAYQAILKEEPTITLFNGTLNLTN
jgi:hypothetical protein